MLRRKKRGNPPYKKLYQWIIIAFTADEERLENVDRVRRSVLKKNRIYGVVFIIAVLIYGLGLFFYLLKPQSFLSSLEKTPKKILNPAVQDGSLESFQQILREKGVALDDLHIASDDATIVGKSGEIIIVFDRFKDVTSQVGSLQQILQRLTIDSSVFLQQARKPESIDLRFSKPIIKY